MSRFRCYITPFDESGEYTTRIEVTNDVNLSSISRVTQKLDQSEFDVGTLTFNNFNLKLRNEHGNYSRPEDVKSIFSKKRNDSIFSIEWEIEDEGCICGIAEAGRTRLNVPKLVYEGFINDNLSSESTKDHDVSFQVISLESIVSRVDVPFSSFAADELISSAIFKTLNNSIITDIITVDVSNINVSIDNNLDDITELETMTGQEALDEFLRLSNSIMWIKDRVVFVKPREASTDVKFTFFGPMATDGLENIQNISEIKSGFSKMFNFLTWSEKTFNVSDSQSIATNGVKKKSFSSLLLTDTTKQQNILANYINEFGQPKAAFKVTAPIGFEVLDLFFMDKVSVDYPTVYIALEGRDIPLYGVARYGQDFYPVPESSIFIDKNRRFKINTVNINTKDQLMTFGLREL